MRAWSGRPWVYVAFCLTAYTGTRRSEILRSRGDDLDFDAGTITIREKKRDRTREMTFRTVPMSAGLKEVLRSWLQADHPGGPYTICGRGGRTLTRQMIDQGVPLGRGRVLMASCAGLPCVAALLRQQLR